MSKRVMFLILIVLALGAAGWYWNTGAKADITYRTAPIRHGDVIATISATGTLEPEEVIDVGAQVAGLIEAFGTDANKKQIDYRSPVEPEMVLAKIDDAVYRADVDTAQAHLAQANTNVQKGEADLATANAKLFQAEENWNRAKDMGPSDALSHNDYNMYRAEYQIAKANVALAQAEIAQAKTSISEAQASLNKAQRNLGFCTIKSPVKGVIIDRRVNIGQTVVSSLNAPSLFLIAKDLTRMQIWAAVNEADVGRINPGAPVTFTCDAFPDKDFTGSVGKVRLNATMAQNVVMYTVEVNTENPKGILLPYLTAHVRFEVQKEADALLVPNAALRWSPVSADQVTPEARAQFKPIEDEPKSGKPDKSDKPDKPEKPQKRERPMRERRGMIWVKAGEFVRPLQVKLGVSDGLSTAISGEGIEEKQEVVVGDVVQSAAAGEHNPFLPPMRRR